jgi:hypothetical protein
VAKLSKFTGTEKGGEGKCPYMVFFKIHFNILDRNDWWVSLEELVEIWDHTVRTILPKLTTIEQKGIHKYLKTELAMPIEWFSRTELEASHGGDKMEMLRKRVHMAMAQTLLVYERLNKFYK